jgi:hypothetical protein
MVLDSTFMVGIPQRPFGTDRRQCFEVVIRRGRRASPLERLAVPRVVPGDLTLAVGDKKVAHRDQHAHPGDVGADAGQHVEEVPTHVGAVGLYPPRHTPEPEVVLREEAQVEPDEHDREAELPQLLAEQAPGHLRVPVVDPGERRERRPTEHHVVEVGDDEISVVQLEVEDGLGQDDAGDAAEEEHH